MCSAAVTVLPSDLCSTSRVRNQSTTERMQHKPNDGSPRNPIEPAGLVQFLLVHRLLQCLHACLCSSCHHLSPSGQLLWCWLRRLWCSLPTYPLAPLPCSLTGGRCTSSSTTHLLACTLAGTRVVHPVGRSPRRATAAAAGQSQLKLRQATARYGNLPNACMAVRPPANKAAIHAASLQHINSSTPKFKPSKDQG